MKKRQLMIIAAIVVAPVIIGFILIMVSQQTGSDKFNLSSQNKKIGLVRIFDVIYSSEIYVRQLQELRKDKSIAGVILRIDSPGGAVAPAQEIYEEVKLFVKVKKPIIVSMGNVAASGGYYIASPAYKIFANPGTITGSIGVIFQFPHYHELLDKIGIKMTTLKAGKFKDIGNPNRNLTEEELAFLQKLINNTHEQFIRDVSAARKMKIKDLRKIADGRILNGKQALDLGLVDSLGSFSTAISYLKNYLSLPERTKIIEKKRHSGFLRDFIFDSVQKYFPFLNNYKIPAGSYFLLENF
ncbi:MAG: signal peptide peptidase SppA [Chitinispirillia bacterium]|jgi:protease-4